MKNAKTVYEVWPKIGPKCHIPLMMEHICSLELGKKHLWGSSRRLEKAQGNVETPLR